MKNWINNPSNIRLSHFTFSVKGAADNYQAIYAERQLGKLRRYLLIIVAPPGAGAPSDAFVSYTKGGQTFYIDGHDAISQRNFALLSQFLTMQAVPPTTAPLTPTISVGAGG